MKCYVGLGSNQGPRLDHLERAARTLEVLAEATHLRASPVYETVALLPAGAPASWDSPYLNAVIELDWSGTAEELLAALKKTERDLGRQAAPRWAPRVIDLDLLLFGAAEIQSDQLTLPHAGIWQRGFVLGPLRDLAPSLVIPGRGITVLERAREIVDAAPQWMGILNLTPDSFSDGGDLDAGAEVVADKARAWAECGVGLLDLGAESTRPGAEPLTPEAEWRRLEAPLLAVAEAVRQRFFRPKISIDTRFAVTARRAIQAGADLVNDVSGLKDPAMLEWLQEAGAECILAHSLSAPVRMDLRLADEADPVHEVRLWAEATLATLARAGVSRDRVVLDPGLGFGKSGAQSWTLLRAIEKFHGLGVRLLVGHSRKSFLNLDGNEPRDRDWESVGASLALARKGVEILRVHEPRRHMRALKAFQRALAPVPGH